MRYLDRLCFLFGADKLKNIPRWTNAEEMSELCEYLVYARHFDLEKVISSDPFLAERRDRIHLLQVENEGLEDVSSTEVRRRFFAGEDYSDLMNKRPYELLQKISPSDFKSVSDEDIIKAHILYDGRFGANAARLKVFKSNAKIFKAWPSYLGNREEHLVAKAYGSEFTVSAPEQLTATVTDCVNADCTDVAKTLLDEGLNPAILNLASRTSPCGGYHKGTFNLSCSLVDLCFFQSLHVFACLHMIEANHFVCQRFVHLHREVRKGKVFDTASIKCIQVIGQHVLLVGRAQVVIISRPIRLCLQL